MYWGWSVVGNSFKISKRQLISIEHPPIMEEIIGAGSKLPLYAQKIIRKVVSMIRVDDTLNKQYKYVVSVKEMADLFGVTDIRDYHSFRKKIKDDIYKIMRVVLILQNEDVIVFGPSVCEECYTKPATE